MTRRQTGWAVAAVLAAILFVCALGSWAFALADESDQPTLVYDGATQSFSYRNVDGTDLFATFKNLVPGDRITQHFTVRAENLSGPTTLYLRTSYDADELNALQAVELTVAIDGAELSHGPVARPSRLNSDTRIAVFPADGSREAHVEIAIPTSVGNEMMDAEHHLRWTFTAQEDGERGGGTAGGGVTSGAAGEPSTASAASGSIAKTGDPLSEVLVPLIAAAAALALFVAAFRRARRP